MSWFQAASAVQRDERYTHVLPNSRKRGRQKSLGYGRSSPKYSTAKFLPTRGTASKNSLRTSSAKHPSRSRAQVEHEKQAYDLVGQDDAAQAIYNRMHQRTAQEQGQPCPLTPSLRT